MKKLMAVWLLGLFVVFGCGGGGSGGGGDNSSSGTDTSVTTADTTAPG